MKPNIAIVGPSGSGKSTSLRTLDPVRSIILNTEMKALPFRSAGKFKLNIPIPDLTKFNEAFNKALISDLADTCVVESFTSYTEHVTVELQKAYDGFDFWNEYKKEVMRFLRKSKNTDKYVIMTAIDKVIEGSAGVEERCIAIDGSLKKLVEKEFVIVLYTDVIINDESGDPEYRFITNKQRGFENVSAKSPDGMFPPVIPNDLGKVIEYIEAYYSEDEEPVEEKK